MEPDVQNHILDNLKELNTSVGKIEQGQKDLAARMDKFIPWVSGELRDTQKDVANLQNWKSVGTWKIGTISAGAGATMFFVAQWVAARLGFSFSGK